MKRKQFEKCRYWKTEHSFDYYKILFRYSGVWKIEHNTIKNKIFENREKIVVKCTKECVTIIEEKINNPNLNETLSQDYKYIPGKARPPSYFIVDIDSVAIRSCLEYFLVKLSFFGGWTPKFIFDSKTFEIVDRVE